MEQTNLIHPTLEDYQSKVLNESWVQLAYKHQWFKLFLPTRFGGAELSLPDGLQQIIHASSIHGSLGWCVNLGSGAAYFYRFLQADAAEKIFSDSKSVIAGSGQPHGKAYKTEGGYLVTGGWDKCSGASYATAFTGNAVFEDGKVHSLVFLREQVKITDNWDLFAMKATASFRFEVENAFVPESFVFDIGEIKMDDSYAIAEMPFDIFARFSMIATLIGTVHCFVQHLETEFREKIRQFETDFENLKQKLESDQSSMLQLAQRYWTLAESRAGFNEHHLLNLKAGISSMSRSLYDACCDLFYKTGISLASENSLAHHAFKDVLMASQHNMMK